MELSLEKCYWCTDAMPNTKECYRTSAMAVIVVGVAAVAWVCCTTLILSESINTPLSDWLPEQMNAVNSDWKRFILALEAAPKQTKVLRRLSEQRTDTHTSIEPALAGMCLLFTYCILKHSHMGYVWRPWNRRRGSTFIWISLSQQ